MVLDDGHDSNHELDVHQQILNSYGEKRMGLSVGRLARVDALWSKVFGDFFKRALRFGMSKEAGEAEWNR